MFHDNYYFNQLYHTAANEKIEYFELSTKKECER